MLGDSFLKFVVSLKLYFTCDQVLDEGRLTGKRSKCLAFVFYYAKTPFLTDKFCRIINNKNLFNKAKISGLTDCLRAKRLSTRKNWLPPKYGVSTNAAVVERAMCAVDVETAAKQGGKKGTASIFTYFNQEV